MTTTVHESTFDRLGGLEVIERAVTQLFDTIRDNPGVRALMPSTVDMQNPVDTAWQVQLWLTDVIGGPMKYDGPELTSLFGEHLATRERRLRLSGLIIEALQAVGTPTAAVDEAGRRLDAVLAAWPASPESVRLQDHAAPKFAVDPDQSTDFPIAWRDESAATTAEPARVESIEAPAVRAETPSRPAPTSHDGGLVKTADDLRSEAQAVEQSAHALLDLTALLNSLAENATDRGSTPATSSVAGVLADAGNAEAMVQQGLAALEAARSVAEGPGRRREVSQALTQLMELARRTNQLVLEASQRAVEEEVADAAHALIGRAGALRSVMATQVAGLTEEAHSVAAKMAQGASTAGRFAELRAAMQVAPSATDPR